MTARAKVNGFIKESEQIIDFAISELNEAKREHDEMRARQSCEKAYLALIKITNAYLVKKGVKIDELPKTERGRHYLIRRFTDARFQESFAKLRQHLHLDAFWDGIIVFEWIEKDLKDLKKVINRVKNL